MKIQNRVNCIIKILIYMVFVISLILPFVLMDYDEYLCGDEVISYSMANNDKGGFVYSEGRVDLYLENEILDDSLMKTITNFYALVKDLIANKKSAHFFMYPRENEIATYSNAEINDWFTKRNDERFNLSSTWFHSLSDDGNSYLFECVLNIVSSIFVKLSGSKWAGFIINYISMLCCFFELFVISKMVGTGKLQGILTGSIWATTVVTVTTVTYIRAYMFASIFALGLVILHISLYQKVFYAKKGIFWQDIAKIIIVYVFGYLSHYTNAIVLGSLALAMFICLIKNKNMISDIVRYCFGIILAIILGILADPVSIMGLGKKFFANSGSSLSINTRIQSAWEYVSSNIFPNSILLIIILCIEILSFMMCKTKNKKRDLPTVVKYLEYSLLIFFVVVLVGTGRLSYARVILPVFVFLVVNSIWTAMNLILENRTVIINICCVFLVAISVVCGVFRGWHELGIENDEELEVENVLSNYADGDALFFRTHANGYQEATDFRNLNKVQVVTIDTDNWENLADINFSNNKNIVIFFSDQTYTEDTLNWISKAGYILDNCLYNNGYEYIYSASKYE